MIEESITAALGPLFGGRVFPDEAPFDTPRPYAFYTQVGGEEPTFIDKTPSGIRNARMQINIWAATRPMPLPAPVMIATLSSSLMASSRAPLTPPHGERSV